MYLRTPKRYAGKDPRRRIVNLKWLWLYLLAPLVLVLAVLAWDYRAPIGGWICNNICHVISIPIPNAPTATATVPVQTLTTKLAVDLQGGNVQNALDSLEQITTEQPNNVQLYTMMAQIMILRIYVVDKSELDIPSIKTKLAAADQAAQAAINANPEVPDGWITEAMVLDYSFKPQEALPYAFRANEIDSKNPMVMTMLAEIYNDLGKTDQAAVLIDQAIDAAKAATPINQAALAHAYYVKASIDPTNNTKYLEAALNVALSFKYDPADPGDYVPIGYIVSSLHNIYVSTSRFDTAIKDETNAVNLDKQDPYLYYLLGRADLGIGHNADAEKEFQKCTDLDANYIKCLRNLGRLAAQTGNWVAVIKDLQPIIDQKSNLSDDYLNLGTAYISGGNQCDKAVPVLQAGLLYVTDDAQKGKFVEALHTCNSVPMTPTSASSDTNAIDNATTSADIPPTVEFIPTPTVFTTLPPPPPK